MVNVESLIPLMIVMVFLPQTCKLQQLFYTRATIFQKNGTVFSILRPIIYFKINILQVPKAVFVYLLLMNGGYGNRKLSGKI